MVKYWCESCKCFVDENHRCEAWPTTTIIKQEIIDTIRAEARAEALRDAADIAEKYEGYMILPGTLRAAITQEPRE